MAWRLGYFEARRKRSDEGLSVEDIDITHRKVLDHLLEERGLSWSEEARVEMVRRWHSQKGEMNSCCDGT